MLKYLRYALLAACVATLWLSGCGGQSPFKGVFGSPSQLNPAPEQGAPAEEVYAPQPSTQERTPSIESSPITPPYRGTRSAARQSEEKSPTPKPAVTSTSDDANQREAKAAISEVDKRLATAQSPDPASGRPNQIDLVRKLLGNARQAYQEQDYLTALSLAHKASVLASHLPAAGGGS